MANFNFIAVINRIQCIVLEGMQVRVEVEHLGQLADWWGQVQAQLQGFFFFKKKGVTCRILCLWYPSPVSFLTAAQAARSHLIDALKSTVCQVLTENLVPAYSGTDSETVNAFSGIHRYTTCAQLANFVERRHELDFEDYA